MRTIIRSGLGLAALALLALAVTSWGDSPPREYKSPKAAGHWTQVGCIKLRLSTLCRDVYRDDTGALWICEDCGSTKKANPARCRPLTSEEVSTGTWCGGS